MAGQRHHRVVVDPAGDHPAQRRMSERVQGDVAGVMPARMTARLNTCATPLSVPVKPTE